jgi:plasmid stabilization system protein ParE
MTVRFLPAAQVELDEAIEWYAKQAPGLGESFLLETLRTIQLIELHPVGWHPISENTRRCRMRRFPYGVIYSLDDQGILIVAVAHLHRRPAYWAKRTRSS